MFRVVSSRSSKRRKRSLKKSWSKHREKSVKFETSTRWSTSRSIHRVLARKLTVMWLKRGLSTRRKRRRRNLQQGTSLHLNRSRSRSLSRHSRLWTSNQARISRRQNRGNSSLTSRKRLPRLRSTRWTKTFRCLRARSRKTRKGQRSRSPSRRARSRC